MRPFLPSHLLRVFLLGLPVLVVASLQAQGTFLRTYGGEQPTYLTAVAVLQSSDLAVAGITYPPGQTQSDLWVARLDPEGEPIWQRSFPTQGPEHVYALVETRDGNLTLVATTPHPETGYPQGLVMQLNRYGEVMWARRHGGEEPGGDQLRALIQTQDGGFAAVGFNAPRDEKRQDLWLLRLDAVGQPLWERHFGTQGAEMAYTLTEGQDGRLYIGGALQSADSEERDGFVLCTDRRGRGLWRQILTQPGPGAVERLIQTSTGDLLAAGWGYAELTESTDAYLWQLSPGGQLKWQEAYGGANADAFYDLEALPQGGYALLGRTASFDDSPDLWLVEVDEEGHLRWQERTEGQRPEWGRSLALLPQGSGFLLGGATRSFAEGAVTGGLLIRTNNRGRFGLAATHGGVANTIIETDEPPVVNQPNWYKPNLYVLSVGVSAYAHEPINLSFAHSDAEAVAERFEQLSGSLFREVHTRVLSNDDATLAQIKQGIAWLEQEATQLDMILVFFSSHGMLDHKGNLYLMPHDVRSDQLFATGLDIRALTEGMNGVPCKKLVLLDACHSGQSGHDLLTTAKAKGAHLNQAVEELLNAEPGLTVMTSSSGNEFSYENPRWGHGAFTKALLEGLDGNADYNSDRIIHLAELNLFITQRVKDLTAGRQHPYTPINLFGDIPLFVVE